MWYQWRPVGLGVKGDARPGPGGDHGRAFFARAVDSDGNPLAVPVDDLFVPEVVDDVNGHRLAFGQAEELTRNLAVISGGANLLSGSQFPIDLGDLDAIVGRLAGYRRFRDFRSPIGGFRPRKQHGSGSE